MQIRWWNSFNLLAVILFAIGIAGALSGGKMVFDPGRAQSGKEWLVYLVAGGLMLVNGFLPNNQDSVKTPAPASGNALPPKSSSESETPPSES